MMSPHLFKKAPHPAWSLMWGLNSQPWDSQLSWDQESGAQSIELPRHPQHDNLLKHWKHVGASSEISLQSHARVGESGAFFSLFSNCSRVQIHWFCRKKLFFSFLAKNKSQYAMELESICPGQYMWPFFHTVGSLPHCDLFSISPYSSPSMAEASWRLVLTLPTAPFQLTVNGGWVVSAPQTSADSGTSISRALTPRLSCWARWQGTSPATVGAGPSSWWRQFLLPAAHQVTRLFVHCFASTSKQIPASQLVSHGWRVLLFTIFSEV